MADTTAGGGGRRRMRGLVAAALVAACAACATTGQGRLREYRIDQAVPLGEDGSAEVGYRAGPFELVRVVVRNRPTAADIATDTRKVDTSHPKPAIVARSRSDRPATVRLTVRLEDEFGTPLMKCSARAAQELAPGATEDWNACFLEGIRTADWPRVDVVHAIVTFQVRE